ncbi:hypothetical protein AB0425_32350 [Actinosynnema sp. NPDC051121]
MNPYEVPDLDVGRSKPLCPLKYEEHERYYVPVDHTEEAFAQFKAAIGDVSAVKRDGRLVVAVGDELCGKSSLLNRCAAWMSKELADAATEVHVLNLVDACEVNVFRPERQRQVYTSVVDELERHELLLPSKVTVLREREEKLASGYFYLSRNLRRDAVLVVLLPPSELPEELVGYAQFAQERLVFMAEIAEANLSDRKWSDVAGASASPPILLQVGRLKAGDGWTFVESRHRLHPNGADSPKVTEKAVQQVISAWNPSIGQLQRLLYGIHNEMLDQPRRKASAEISFAEITRLHFMTGRAQKRIRGS